MILVPILIDKSPKFCFNSGARKIINSVLESYIFKFIFDQPNYNVRNTHVYYCVYDSNGSLNSNEMKSWMSLVRFQTTQPTSGGAVTADSSCCANCVEPPRPQQWGLDLPSFGHAGHADPLDGWRCCSQKRVMSRPIQVRQL